MSKPHNAPARADLYQRVTDSIIRDLEQGARPWTKPWATSTRSTVTRPLRHDGTPYKGVNVLILWGEACDHGYASPTWMTYRQAEALGAQVRKGEHGTSIVFVKPIERRDDNTGSDQDGARTIPLLRAYTVFNSEQIDGLPERYLGATPSLPEPDISSSRIDRADAFVTATGAAIVHKGDRACYIPSADRIEMPRYSLFRDTETSTAAESYYATLLHELVHWTSPKQRCDRELGKRFGDEAYAREELIAEIGAAFLCAELGIALEPRPDHAGYIHAWLKILKSDKRAVFSATALAQKATDWLIEKGRPADRGSSLRIPMPNAGGPT